MGRVSRFPGNCAGTSATGRKRRGGSMSTQATNAGCLDGSSLQSPVHRVSTSAELALLTNQKDSPSTLKKLGEVPQERPLPSHLEISVSAWGVPVIRKLTGRTSWS